MLQIVKKSRELGNSGFHLAQEKEDNRTNLLPIVLTYFSGVSILLWLSDLTEMLVNPWGAVLLILLLPLLCMKWRYLLPVLSTAVFLIGTISFARQGFFSVVNSIILQYNTISASEVSYFSVDNATGFSTQFFLLTFLSLFILAVFSLLRGRHWIVLTIVYVFMDGSLIFLLRENSIVYLVFSTMALLGCMVYCQRSEKDTRILSGGMVGLSLLCCAIGLIYVNASNMKPFPQVNEMKRNIVQWGEEKRYGKLDLPEGNLERQPINQEEPRFQVTLSKPALIYLRGYTASKFTNNQWLPVDNETYAGNRQGMFQAYLRNGFHPMAELWLYGKLIGEKEEGLCQELTMSIEQTGGSKKYEWLPYGMDLSGIRSCQRLVKDEVVLGKSDGQHGEYKVLNYDYDKLLAHKTEQLTKLQSQQGISYRSGEKDYYEFVKENYSGEKTKPDQDLAQLCIRLRKELAKTGQAKNWNSMNYASEGVQQLRNHGYCARYVEGYYIDGRQKNENDVIQVTSSAAHAWAEVYKEDVGFVPVELTPGYYDNMVVEEEQELQEKIHEVTQMEGISTDVPEEEEEEGSYAWIIGWGIVVLLILFVLVVIIRNVIIRRKRKYGFASEKQRIRLEMLSSYMLLLYTVEKRDEREMPENCTELWNKFWFSREGILEDQEEQELFAYSQKFRQTIMEKSSWLRRMYLRIVGI